MVEYPGILTLNRSWMIMQISVIRTTMRIRRIGIIMQTSAIQTTRNMPVASFDVDSSGGDGSLNPNSTYSDWKWILVRTNGGHWQHVDHGY